jgi:hypothetical protein
MRATPLIKESEIISRILLGEKYSDISLKTGVAVSTIKKIKKRNQAKFIEINDAVTVSVIDEVRLALGKTYKALNRLLDKDQAGDINLSVRELLIISNAMHKQSVINYPSRSTPLSIQNVLEKYQ